MPGLDRTGPMGAGPMTGRGLGLCGGARPGLLGWGRGRGAGFGLGLGLGWRRGACRWAQQSPLAPADEAQLLQRQADALEQQLTAVKRRIESLGQSGE